MGRADSSDSLDGLSRPLRGVWWGSLAFDLLVSQLAYRKTPSLFLFSIPDYENKK